MPLITYRWRPLSVTSWKRVVIKSFAQMESFLSSSTREIWVSSTSCNPFLSHLRTQTGLLTICYRFDMACPNDSSLALVGHHKRSNWNIATPLYFRVYYISILSKRKVQITQNNTTLQSFSLPKVFNNQSKCACIVCLSNDISQIRSKYPKTCPTIIGHWRVSLLSPNLAWDGTALFSHIFLNVATQTDTTSQLYLDSLDGDRNRRHQLSNTKKTKTKNWAITLSEKKSKRKHLSLSSKIWNLFH